MREGLYYGLATVILWLRFGWGVDDRSQGGRKSSPFVACENFAAPRLPAAGAVDHTGREEWRHDALRHSFGAYRFAENKNPSVVAYEMGNSLASFDLAMMQLSQTLKQSYGGQLCHMLHNQKLIQSCAGNRQIRRWRVCLGNGLGLVGQLFAENRGLLFDLAWRDLLNAFGFNAGYLWVWNFLQ